MLAAGQLDVVLDVDLDAHDVQPLIPIIEAAGGVVSDWAGRPCYDGGTFVACGDAGLHSQILKLIG